MLQEKAKHNRGTYAYIVDKATTPVVLNATKR